MATDGSKPGAPIFLRLVMFGLIVFGLWKLYGHLQHAGVPGLVSTGVGSAATVSLLTTATKTDLMNALAHPFEQQNPGWTVNVETRESRAGLWAVLDGTIDPMPDLYSPSDPGFATSLDRAWVNGTGRNKQYPRVDLLGSGDPDQDVEFAETPIVFVTTPDKLQRLAFLARPHPWEAIRRMSAGKSGGDAPLHFSFASPLVSASGLLTLGMIDQDHEAGAPTESTAAYLRQVCAGLVYDAPAQTGSSQLFDEFINEINRGEMTRDFIVTYESNALKAVAQNPSLQIAVIYPNPVPRSIHRICVLNGGWNSGPQHDASVAFVKFIKSDDGQAVVMTQYMHPMIVKDTLPIEQYAGDGFKRPSPADFASPYSYDELMNVAGIWSKTEEPRN